MATYAKNAVKHIPKAYGYVKQGWNEVPELVLAISFASVGSVLALYGGYRAGITEESKKKHRTRFTVYREGDPRIKYIKDITF